MLIFHRQFGNCLLSIGQNYILTAQNIHKTLNKSIFDISALAIFKTSLFKEAVILGHTGICCLLLPQNRDTAKINLMSFSKAQYCLNKPSNKNTGQRFTLELNSVHIWGGWWPGWSNLQPDVGMKVAAWHWRKRCWLSITTKLNQNNILL